MIFKAPEEERKQQNKQSLIGGAMVLTVAMAVVKIVGALYRMPLSIIFGGYGTGTYNQAYAFYATVYSIAVTGFPVAVSKVVAGYAREGRFRDIKRTLRVANLLFFGLGAAGALALFFSARFYSDTVLKNEYAFYSILAVAPSVLFSCLMATHRGFHQGMRNMTPTAVSQVVEVLVKVAVGLTAAYWIKSHFLAELTQLGTVMGKVYPADDAEMLILAYTSAGAIFGVTVSTFAGWLFLQIRHIAKGDGITRAQLENSPAAAADRLLLRQILLVGIPIALGSVTVSLTGQIDSIMIQNRLIGLFGAHPETLIASHGASLAAWAKSKDILLSDISSAGAIATFLYGCYGFGTPFFNLVPAITGSLGMSALPHITDSWLARDRATTKEHIESTVKVTMLFAAPMGFGICALAEPILHLFFSRTPEEVAIGGPMLSILGLSAICLALSGPVNSMLQAIGRLDIPVKMLIAGGVVKIVSNYFLIGIPSVNIHAAPAGSFLCYGLISVASVYLLMQNTGIRLNLKGIILKPLFAGALSGGAGWLCYFLLMKIVTEKYIRPKVATLVAIAAAAVVYFICLSLFRVITREDLETLPKGEKIAKLLEKLYIIR